MGIQAKGSQARIVCASESTFKTLGTTNKVIIPFTSESLRTTRDFITSNIIRGNRNPYMPITGNYNVNGDITTELAPYLGKLFYHLLGTVSTSGTSSPYTHTFMVSTLPTGLSIEKQFTDLGQYILYKGCKINSARVTVRPESMIEITFNVLGSTFELSSSSQISSPTNLTSLTGGPFTAYEAAILIDNSSTIAIVTEIDLTIENGLEGLFVLDGTAERAAINEGIVSVSGTVRALFDSVTLLNKAVNSTECSLSIGFTHGTGAGTFENESLTFEIPELKFSQNDPVISGPAGILVELPFRGYYQNDLDASSIIVTLACPLSDTQVL